METQQRYLQMHCRQCELESFSGKSSALEAQRPMDRVGSPPLRSPACFTITINHTGQLSSRFKKEKSQEAAAITARGQHNLAWLDANDCSARSLIEGERWPGSHHPEQANGRPGRADACSVQGRVLAPAPRQSHPRRQSFHSRKTKPLIALRSGSAAPGSQIHVRRRLGE